MKKAKKAAHKQTRHRTTHRAKVQKPRVIAGETAPDERNANVQQGAAPGSYPEQDRRNDVIDEIEQKIERK